MSDAAEWGSSTATGAIVGFGPKVRTIDLFLSHSLLSDSPASWLFGPRLFPQ